MATAKNRSLDSISDGPAPSEPEAKRHGTACLTELSDELLIMIAEHLAGFDDPITYVHKIDGKLIIEHPKAYHDVSLAGLRGLSDTLCVEFEKALHRNGIITFENQHVFAEYFQPAMLNSHPRMKDIRLATQRLRFNLVIHGVGLYDYELMQSLVNLKKIHLGGAWRDKDGPLRLTPTKSNASFFKHQAVEMLIFMVGVPRKNVILQTTYGPGRFSRNTMVHPEPDDKHYCYPWDDGSSNEVNHATLDELLAVWKEDQDKLACINSIVPMDEETLNIIKKYFLFIFLRLDDPEI